MTWEYKGNLKGPRGERGTQGLPGLNAEATDAGVAAYVSADVSATSTAVKNLIGELTGVNPETYAYNVHEGNMGIIRNALRNGNARISVHGSSTPYGHSSGTPYLYTSYTGRLNRIMAGRFGPKGPGMMIPWEFYVPPYELQTFNRNYFFGGTYEARPFGIYTHGAIRITGTTSFIGVRDVDCDGFRVIFAGPVGGGTATVSVDGVSVGTVPTSPDTTGTTFTKESGYAFDSVSGTGQVSVVIPAVPKGDHTLTISPNTVGGAAAFTVLSIEPLVRTRPGVVVSNLALSGQSLGLASLTTSDTSNGFQGMSVSMDAPRAHLNIGQFGTIDYIDQVPIATFKTNLGRWIDRSRSATPVANGGTKIAADALLVAGQPINEAAYPATSGIPFSAYTTASYEVAAAYDAPLLDLTELFVSYAAGVAKDLYADDLHLKPIGHEMIAKAVDRVVMLEV